MKWSIAEYTTPYAPVPKMPFSCRDSPRKLPILDSGVGGQFLGGGVDGGVNGALCMAKAETKEGEVLWIMGS